MKQYVIIVAGGKGLRMGGDLPKQFIPLAGKPVLMRTLENFFSFSPDIDIILVLPHDHQEYWRNLCGEYGFGVPHRIADGGATRFHSVRNGLALVEEADDAVVAVHDGVRPFVSHDVIARCFDMAAGGRAVVPVTGVVETVRRMKQDGTSVTVPRGEYRLVQTPQVFPSRMIKKAYTADYIDSFTDDASVVEAMDIDVELAEGNRENIKITTPFDMVVAEALCQLTAKN
ncbi:2-C-methyl-D-erythritol 4-phosphate cytidylyltransferase [uncultured Bacteroides sp.]|uniref:2-C-methyl-D-erythritol 4-phosphate cytidylyltransferase n=1 Tax=uncultured Bacteroides sp. TaxID=162156 RepID=UPI0026135F13|nr:2-C-methyl-D-erythritol 4-phosphate cytidylyltransferase [uncultured Bacteroides sp.]